jgi:Rrf2 family nitric oxide-sensitive transcriptional repressor
VTLTKASRYALYAVLEMSVAGDEPVTVSGMARRHGMSQTALAKVLQQLMRAGLAVGARGVGGGYRLARPASALTVLDVISVFERSRAPGQALLGGRSGAGPVDAALRRLFDEVDELVRGTFASVTVETLARTAAREREAARRQ